MFTVALIGPDGAGKTTVARHLEGTLPVPVKYIYMGVNPDASNRMLPTTRLIHKVKRACGAKPDTAGPLDPDKPKSVSKNPVKRFLKKTKSCLALINRMCDEWYRQLLASYYRRHGNVVLFDRHYLFDFHSYDVATNGKSIPLGNKIHGMMLSHMYPKPDYVIFLDAPGEVLYARKQEGTPELLERRRQDYLEIGSTIEHFSIVDATQPQEEVLKDVSQRIIDLYEAGKQKKRKAKPPKSSTILVTDSGLGSAVSIIRSLGKKGYRVISGSASYGSPGVWSCHSQEQVVYPSPITDPEGYIDALEQAVKDYNVDLILPVTDAAILPLSAARDRFDGLCRLALPEQQALEQVTSKDKTLELAQSLNIPVPQSCLVETVAEALQKAQSFQWPIVLKPRASLIQDNQTETKHFEVRYAGDDVELEKYMREFEGYCPVLLQEYCPGTGFGVELLTCEGRPLAAFQHKRLREVPVTGGASSLRESVPLNETLFDYACQLMKALNWTGLAMVEFKVNGDDIHLMEINGRVWGSLPLAIHAGMDFPARLVEMLLNGPPKDNQSIDTDYKSGVRSRNTTQDLLWIASVLRGKQKYSALPIPARKEAIKAILSFFHPKIKYDIADIKDPLPGLAFVPGTIRKFFSKMRKR